MEYVSSVYPHWVEQAALHREKKRIMGNNASLRAEAATRAPHPTTRQMREWGSRNENRHVDTLVPPTFPVHLSGTTHPQGINYYILIPINCNVFEKFSQLGALLGALHGNYYLRASL